MQVYEKREEICKNMCMKPVVDLEKYDRVIKNHIYSLIDSYVMNP